jgi:hypothetical protein
LWSFSPYVSWRRGALPFAGLAPLVPSATWRLLDTIDLLRDERRGLAAAILPHLHQSPPFSEQSRRTLIELQRDLYNDRMTALATVEAAQLHLEADAARALADWRRMFEREAELVACCPG